MVLKFSLQPPGMIWAHVETGNVVTHLLYGSHSSKGDIDMPAVRWIKRTIIDENETSITRTAVSLNFLLNEGPK